jgi:hypothetical protein
MKIILEAICKVMQYAIQCVIKLGFECFSHL